MIKEIVKSQFKFLFLPVFIFGMFYGISNMNSYDYFGSIINIMGGTITNFAFYIIILSVNIIVYSTLKNTSIFIRYKSISRHILMRKVIELISSSMTMSFTILQSEPVERSFDVVAITGYFSPTEIK